MMKSNPKAHQTIIFQSGNSKAVRIPISVNINVGDAVLIKEQEGAIIIEPVKKKMKGLGKLFRSMGNDFMEEGREDIQERDL